MPIASARTNSDLDGVLQDWHAWESQYTPTRGFATRALVVGEFRISRQYDDSNGALDDDLHNRRMRDVAFEVGELPTDQRYAICDYTKGLSVGGAMVWRNPRLPSDDAERLTILRQAKQALIAKLVGRGILIEEKELQLECAR